MKIKSLKINDSLILKPAHTDFAEEIFSIVDQQREYLGEWLSWVSFTNAVENTQKFLTSAMQWNIDGHQNTWFIFNNGNICGSIGYVKINHADHNGEIGYWLSETSQGLGIMTQACQKIIEYGFTKLGFKRIEIRVIKENEKSIAIPKRLHFTAEGIHRQSIFLHSKFWDTYMFSLLQQEFMAKK